jgi:2-polyprenyl-6-methoxyphenol hydroxylase-like FAD-dependent oxidoreductase
MSPKRISMGDKPRILIVGAGIAGRTLAAGLAQQGITPEIVEIADGAKNCKAWKVRSLPNSLHGIRRFSAASRRSTTAWSRSYSEL